VNRAKHKADMDRLSQVACYFPSFADVQGRRTGCDFLDLGDGVGYLLAMAQVGASVGCDFHNGFLCLHSDRMYDNLILGIHTMSIWFWP
jgi:hypothetical protein